MALIIFVIWAVTLSILSLCKERNVSLITDRQRDNYYFLFWLEGKTMPLNFSSIVVSSAFSALLRQYQFVSHNNKKMGTIHLRRRHFLGRGGEGAFYLECSREGGRSQKSWKFANVFNGWSLILIVSTPTYVLPLFV